MAGFDLNNYENVKERKKRFYTDYPGGRLMVQLVNDDYQAHVLFKAWVYLSEEDQKNGLPRACGYAHEIRDTELRKTKYGKEYESVNYTSWIENCEESAVGRALDNAGYASNMRCSKEEIIKAEGQIGVIKKQNAKATAQQIGKLKELNARSKNGRGQVELDKFLAEDPTVERIERAIAAMHDGNR